MRIRISTVFLLISLFISLTFQTNSLAHAEDATVDYYAVIVGVADYPGWINDLSYTTDSAKSLSDRLAPVWGENNVKLLVDRRATKANIKDAILSWLDERVDDNDVVLFSYSGHGLPDYLCPYDSLATSYANDISASELDGWLTDLASDNIVVVLESCYSGSFTSILSQTGRIILASGSANQASYDGVFMIYITEAFDNFTDVDTNRDYALSIEEIFTYASSKAINFVTKDLYDYQDPQIDDRYTGQLEVLYEATFDINPHSILLSVIVDEQQYNNTELPISFRWVPGSRHYLEINSSSSDWVSMPAKTFSEGGEYSLVYLTVESEYGNPQGEGWYMEGTSASVSITSPQGVIVRNVFGGWSGDITATTSNTTIVMDGIKTVTAQWHKDYVQLFILLAGLLGAAALIGVLLKKRGRKLLPVVNKAAISVSNRSQRLEEVRLLEQKHVAPPIPEVSEPKRSAPAVSMLSEQATTMYCSNCGTKISGTANFCKNCGHNLKVGMPMFVEAETKALNTKCFRHPEVNAVGICTQCGNSVCALCKSGVKDKIYCPSCIGVDVYVSTPLSDKSITMEDTTIQEELKAEILKQEVIPTVNSEDANNARQENALRTQRFNWFRERPNAAIFLAGILLSLAPLLSLYVVSKGFNSIISGLLETLYQNSFIIPIIFSPLSIFTFVVISWACKCKGISIWWSLLIAVPYVSLFIMTVCNHSYYFCVDSKGITDICHYTEYKVACFLLPIAWIITMMLPKLISKLSFRKP